MRNIALPFRFRLSKAKKSVLLNCSTITGRFRLPPARCESMLQLQTATWMATNLQSSRHYLMAVYLDLACELELLSLVLDYCAVFSTTKHSLSSQLQCINVLFRLLKWPNGFNRNPCLNRLYTHLTQVIVWIK